MSIVLGKAKPLSLCLSVVSHGQGVMVRHLLDDLECAGLNDFEVILTINVPEDETFIGSRPYRVRVIRNEHPKGFGANHNSAFGSSTSEYFAVVNPDVRIPRQDWSAFFARLNVQTRTAACSPRVVNSSGDVEDHARSFPTLAGLIARRIGRVRDKPTDSGCAPFEPDWVAGMFVIFRASAFHEVGGFDAKRFFMYFEDVDICRRLRSRGWTINVDPSVSVIHDAQRASRRDLRHFLWHVTSAFRYLSGV